MAGPLSDVSAHLTFMAPLSEARAGRLIQFLARDLSGTVLDVGCGWGSLLLRILAAAPTAQGIGVDLDEASLLRAGELAQTAGLADRVEFRPVDVSHGGLDDLRGLSAALCVGASHAWPREDPDDPRMNYRGALRGLRSVVGHGGRVVFGDGIWSRPPTAAAIKPLGGRKDEMVGLPQLVEVAEDERFAVHAFHEATLDEWDVFESGYTARYAAWLGEAGAGDEARAEIEARARTQHTAYLGGYRGILGMAYLELIAIS